MKRLQFAFGIALLVAVAPQATRHLSGFLGHALTPTPAGWLDEDYVLDPALRIYSGGYKACRCRENNPGSCYGGTQAYLDAALLKLVRPSVIQAHSLLSHPGTPWFYQSRYPEAFRVLRTSRVIASVWLCLVLAAFALAARFGAPTAVALGFSLTAFPTFANSYQGLKNDFPSALSLLLFLGLARLSFQAEPIHRRSLFYWATIALGTLSLGIKFGIIIPLVLFIALFLTVEIIVTRSPRPFIKRVLGTGVLSGILWLASNPNLFVSSTEASWQLGQLVVGRVPFDGSRTRGELFTLGLPHLWPWALALSLGIPLLFKRKTPLRAKAFNAFLLTVPALWAWPTLAAAKSRGAYYLPITAWSLATLFLLVQNFGRIRKELQVAVVLFLLGFTIHTQGLDFTAGTWPQASSNLQGVETFLDGKTRRFALDLNLRPAVVQGSISAESILFFDSLSESPSEVRAQIHSRWGSHPATVRVACWAPTQSSDPSLLTSPSAKAWAAVTHSRCERSGLKENSLSTELVYAFENGKQAGGRIELDAGTLPVSGLPLPIQQTLLNPRMLKGSFSGLDYWFSPLILYRETSLEGRFRWPAGLQQVRLRAESSCKDRGEITLEISHQNGKQTAQTRSLDIRPQVCREWPWVCKLGFEHWWMKRYEIEPFILSPKVLPGESATIRLTSRGLDQSRCRVALQGLELTARH